MRAASRRTRWILAAACVLGVVVVSVLPSGPGLLGGWDRSISPRLQDAGHVPAYCLVFLSLAWAQSASRTPAWGRLLLTALACCALGMVLEIVQAFVPGRTCSVSDELANIGGVTAGLLGSGILRAARAGRLRRARPQVTGLPGTGLEETTGKASLR
jgi:VanZ family protein